MVGIPVAGAFVSYRTPGAIDSGASCTSGCPIPGRKIASTSPSTSTFDVDAGVTVNLAALGIVGLNAGPLGSNIGVAVGAIRRSRLRLTSGVDSDFRWTLALSVDLER